ncbi:MupA/Atu3671 family FMN-dependent luciferase-like monooxygenase [Kutzneria kofuensis]|uniref:Natural product biosynthesis luciferase-like monooxygenase protein n=1 Tax=Kutzneria kofuensis TaxID=103725 RepID=A0A7W9NLE2_9PSEU|nr:MupA/Atu3671 family FMN-dependent luciferase-like monooxygenase [Kutzneria kofuensis]MBB5896376.1 natural product biosynthesis luciferase-like monooxygenase protein [Kutzneria kofuensis]
MDFSLFYFADDADRDGAESRYRLLLEGAQLADRSGLAAVWTPERHFHRFGGVYPDPAVTGAALATVTERIQIRAGSVVSPLHDPLEVVERWAVVDNLSHGRVGLSLASGWHATDFATRPEAFERRRELVVESVEQIRQLWAGVPVKRTDGGGRTVEVRAFPPPVRGALPLWLTSAGSIETFQAAGRLGVGVLTYLVGHTLAELADKIAAYRAAARAASGDSWAGHVVLMVHVYLDRTMEDAKEAVRGPLRNYLRSSLDLNARSTRRGAGEGTEQMSPADAEALVDRSLAGYFSHHGVFGTVDYAATRADELAGIGVDEMACLIDFGVADEVALASVRRIAELNREFNGEPS